ncbi:MAG TPA: M20 family metallopeptidase, partial [Phycisphaerae bacterium]
MFAYLDEVERLRDRLISIRHDLHAHPELAFEEKRTSAKVVEELRKLPGLKLETGLAGTGVVATLNAEKPGPCVALRADMDCLPVLEQNEFDYVSKHPGRMHACGHDGHTTCLLGAAMVLAQHADELPGRVKFVFQPAEEGGGGGGIMVQQGILDDVDAAFALHGWPEAKVGTIACGAGPSLAATAEFDVLIRGKQAHAAYPQNSRDPIVTAGHIITAVQSIVARNTSPLDAVVVSICKMEAGTAYNIIPEEARLAGTIRCYSTEIQQ